MVSITNLKMSFSSQTLFEDISFTINQGERIGLVGQNGSGKTTLFNILLNKTSPDDGFVEIPRNYTIGIVEQHINFSQQTVIDEGCMGLGANHKDEKWKVEKILSGLGFSSDDLQRDPREFSGGFQVRLNLTKALAGEPHLLLLDEPTNYLDIASIKWITKFLREWKNELILITHDRFFMDSVVTHIMAFHRKRLKKIKGNTEKIYDQMAKEEEIYEKTRLNEEKKDKQTKIFISRFRAKARLAGMVQSRIKELAKKEKLEKLEKIQNLEFAFNYCNFNAKYLLHAKDLTFHYEKSANLLENFSLSVGKEERICIIGKNGKGKSTLLKLIADELEPISGSVEKHANTSSGYFGQTNILRFHLNNTIEEELALATTNTTYNMVKNICGAMMFSGEDSKKQISILSGGEKSRVALGKILLKECNLLLLDEPTNHLDMQSCDSLLMAISSFPGAVVMVTHNEMFLRSLATKLVIFDRDTVFIYDGNYNRFLEDIGWSFNDEKQKQKQVIKNNDKKVDRKLKSELRIKRTNELRPILKQIEEIENKIEKSENELTLLENEIVALSQSGKGSMLEPILKKSHSLQTVIDDLFAQYETLLNKKEQIEKNHDNQ